VTRMMDVSARLVSRVARDLRSAQRRTAPPIQYRGTLVASMRELAIVNPERGRRYSKDLLREKR
jgi:hypothetical protein